MILVPKDNVKLLGMTIGSELNFMDHVKSLCFKMSKKVNAVSLVARITDYKKSKLLYSAFVLSSLNYCPLVLMSTGR